MSNPNEIACRPRDALVSISRRYPGLWKYVDSVRAMRGKGRNAWPEYCFLPCLATVELIERFNPGGADIRDSNQACNEAVFINALAAWRVTQGVGDGVRRPINPTAKRINGGEYRLFPPNQVTTWGVGVRIGAALRRATEYASSGDGEATGRNAPRGHIRRAHWHGFRSGPTKTADGNTVNTSDRKFEVRWLPPLAINLGDLSDLPSTIRAVS